MLSVGRVAVETPRRFYVRWELQSRTFNEFSPMSRRKFHAAARITSRCRVAVAHVITIIIIILVGFRRAFSLQSALNLIRRVRTL